MDTEQEQNIVRRRSKVEVYFHFVWATRQRQPLLTPERERLAYRAIGSEAMRLGCTVLALNGMPDHVHLVVQASGTAAPSTLAKQIKGVSSALLNNHRPLTAELFRWQDGYACFSLGRPQLAAVITYVSAQKAHHAADTLWPQWEETTESAN